MTLRKYQEDEGLTTAQLAKKLKLSVGQTSDLLNRQRGCSLKVAVRIERITGGLVSCRDLLPLELAK
jgi:plasmid maintenance system antidote protein VapI